MLEDSDQTSLLPCAVLAPVAQLPATWTHPDLKRLREDHRSYVADETPNIARAEALGNMLSLKISQLLASRDQQKAQIEALAKQLEAIQQGLLTTEASAAKWQTVERSWKDQIIFHKTIGQTVLQLPLSSSDATASPSKDGGPVRRFSLSSQWSPISLRSFVEHDSDAVSFLKRLAPSMHLSAKDGCLLFPTFSEDPCILGSTAGGNTPTCGNPLCVYAHADQTNHVLRCVEYLLQFLEPFHGKGSVCAVGEFVDRMHHLVVSINGVSAVSERKALVALHTVASFILAFRLHKALMLPGKATLEGGAALAAGPVENLAQLFPKASVATVKFTLISKWLLSVSERKVALTATEKALVDVLKEAPDLASMEQALIRDMRCTAPAPLTWRLLMAVKEAQGGGLEQIAWLAAKGIQLFPTSAELHLWHLSTAVRDSSVTEEECVQIFNRSSSIVSGQAFPLLMASSSSSSSSSGADSHQGSHDDMWSSALLAVVCSKFKSSESLAAFLTSAIEHLGKFAPTVEMAFNVHLLLVAAHMMPFSSVSSSFLATSDVAAPSILSRVPLSLHRDTAVRVPQAQLNSDKARSAIMRFGKFLERNKAFIGEHKFQLLTNTLRSSVMRTRRIDSKLFHQSVQAFEPDPWASHLMLWDEYLSIVHATEGPAAALDVCKALEVTGDIALQLLAARHAVQMSPSAASHTQALAEAVSSFRKAKNIEHHPPTGMARLAGDAAAPSRLRVSIPHWVCFLTAYASTCSAVSDGLAVLRAIPRQVLEDPSASHALQWRLSIDTAALLVGLDDVKEFASGFETLLAGLTSSATLENCIGVRQQDVTVAHYFSLEVYRSIPLLEWRLGRISELRAAVLSASISYGCLHPLLVGEAN
jgi:hypothetical protein